MAQPTPVAPDSPRSEQTPPPPGIQGDLEQELMGLANSLYNLGVTVINDTTRDLQGGQKPVGSRVYVNVCQGFLAYDLRSSQQRRRL